jgi:hypothetical protein
MVAIASLQGYLVLLHEGAELSPDAGVASAEQAQLVPDGAQAFLFTLGDTVVTQCDHSQGSMRSERAIDARAVH